MKDIIEVSTLNKTWVFDLDGTICIHNGYKTSTGDVLLNGAKDFLNNIASEDMIIFVTSRKSEYRKITEKFLSDNHIRYNYIIFDAPYGERIIVNDRKPAGLNTAISINTERDRFMNIDFKENENL